MFETGEWKLSEYEVEGSKIYVIDNFYKDPDFVYNYSIDPLPNPWKHNPHMGYNMDRYEDRRRVDQNNNLVDIYGRLSAICGQPPEYDNQFVTNVTKFYDRAYNNFERKYWWPHKDLGYNGIVYLNNLDSHPGTNLYSVDSLNPLLPEWMCPWVSRDDYNLIHTIESKYNRLVLFDGHKFHHGMAIEDDRYFYQYRVNQVYFFYGAHL